MQFVSRAWPRLQQALDPAPRAPHPSQYVGIGDPGAQAEVAPAWATGRELDGRPIRRACQSTGQSLDCLLSGGGQLAMT